MMRAGVVLAVMLTAPAALPWVAPSAAQARDCGVDLTVQPAATAGLLDITLDAPCAPGQMATIFHDALSFQSVLDNEGHLGAQIPALAREALVMVSLPDGTSALAQTSADSGPPLTLLLPENAAASLFSIPESTPIGQAGFYWSGAQPVQIRVDDALCGQELLASVLSVDGDHQTTLRPLQVALPACDAAEGLTVSLSLGG
ncbi:hypothetical protein [Ketogulonicigenium vulgare]|uniref:Uncharacterized protein n=1 Tax=Ketogulonicigenium vulgare (strain WSH-001) TaxID=759362 RepID=F9Y646_KETVW|nr:hypothetical protein [Ketogulonicigenium vulgare]ADO43780.1 conserved hypothetical protein [Ketogulonicigenium vulgare Y25]AEM42043.1 hypothetical protein KVU_2203 [Ketogulonicigenium vulgare WSH-001]ALJ82139.1 hypothetical protein KVH_13780 [Ketogulonicigenium vulgare]ANW34762.1 hypothetical protein KvSKV_13690 [Ketogulonicigenium vulgare]AOZ55813.1 hypothetical protein KVC_2811 [Ketogulonicigenium vulgare]